ncbi:hypothetical protein AB3464_03395 [Pseudomonas asplenii]|uniref:N-acyl amino acid synthase FeeM domain-containing protein n=1 Tax=Pseudomonas asplenii TaxID=53407 RepID=UPI002234160F|nr:hypothetical protein [Pseudomonas asplenii]UZE26918.1 hypothetical protein LOY63_16115 [Pseudomonas asplenii]
MSSYGSNKAVLPFATMQLLQDDSAGLATQAFYDSVVQEHCQSDKVSVRQVVTPEQFSELSRARYRLYGQRKVYYRTLFGDSVDETVCLDEYDSRSYVFACYYDGDIIGTQRITPFPHESGEYIEHQRLLKFSGPGYEKTCVELSRLIVDKHAPVKNVVTALAMTGASLVALLGGYRTFITYVKPRLAPKFESSVFDQDGILFQIPARGEHYYALYKGELLPSVTPYFGLDQCPADLKDIDALMRYTLAARASRQALAV